MPKWPDFPKGWTVIDEYVGWAWPFVFAKYLASAKTVWRNTYAWCPTWIYTRFVLPHEAGHAHGLPGHSNPWCLMWEGLPRSTSRNPFKRAASWLLRRDTWREKVVAVVLVPFGRLFRGHWLCLDCQAKLANSESEAEG